MIDMILKQHLINFFTVTNFVVSLKHNIIFNKKDSVIKNIGHIKIGNK